MIEFRVRLGWKGVLILALVAYLLIKAGII
jgi:hypothetical protein